jgi:hypothetical protein
MGKALQLAPGTDEHLCHPGIKPFGSPSPHHLCKGLRVCTSVARSGSACWTWVSWRCSVSVRCSGRWSKLYAIWRAVSAGGAAGLGAAAVAALRLRPSLRCRQGARTRATLRYPPRKPWAHTSCQSCVALCSPASQRCRRYARYGARLLRSPAGSFSFRRDIACQVLRSDKGLCSRWDFAGRASPTCATTLTNGGT